VFGHHFFRGRLPWTFLEYSYGPGSGLFAIPLPAGRTGPDGLGRQAQRTGAAVAAAVVLRQRQEAIAACRIRSFFGASYAF